MHIEVNKVDHAVIQYLKNNDLITFYHTIGWKNVIERTFGHKPYYLIARDGKKVLGILPIFHIKSYLTANAFVSIPLGSYGGVVADSPVVEEALIEEAKKIAFRKKVDFIELRYMHNNSLFSLTTKLSKVSMILDLSDNPGIMWKKIGPKCRNQVRKAKKSGLTTRFGKEYLSPFYRVFAENMRDLGIPVFPKSLFENMLCEFPDNVNFLIVCYRDKPIGGACMVFFKEVVEVPNASSLRKYFSLCPNMLLYWEAIRISCEMGYKKFDFGRSTKDSPTYKFKRQWGAKPVQLYYKYILISSQKIPDITTENRRFKLAGNFWKRLPLWVTNSIGPYITRHIF